tara:strand:- start:577 stop:1233 length:657 start_codon:yes stop_codon:yes gene_type:complete
MDGNGRWAKEKGLSRIEGHKQGVNVVREIITYCSKINVKYLTLFTFSEENWKRPKKEVIGLMNLLVSSLKKETESLKKNNIKFSVIGDLKKIDIYTRSKINQTIKITESNDGLNLNLAISYGSRQEIVQAINQIIKEKKNQISMDELPDFLYTKKLPDPDLLIRTGKEKRISNFLLWQIPYTEIFFSNSFWPDFNENELNNILKEFTTIERRYGIIND